MHMVAYVCIWLHMCAYGYICVHMVAYVCMWLHMCAYGCICVHMCAHGHICLHMGTSVCIWAHLCAYGHTGQKMETAPTASRGTPPKKNMANHKHCLGIPGCPGLGLRPLHKTALKTQEKKALKKAESRDFPMKP